MEQPGKTEERRTDNVKDLHQRRIDRWQAAECVNAGSSGKKFVYVAYRRQPLGEDERVKGDKSQHETVHFTTVDERLNLNTNTNCVIYLLYQLSVPFITVTNCLSVNMKQHQITPSIDSCRVSIHLTGVSKLLIRRLANFQPISIGQQFPSANVLQMLSYVISVEVHVPTAGAHKLRCTWHWHVYNRFCLCHRAEDDRPLPLFTRRRSHWNGNARHVAPGVLQTNEKQY